MHVTCRHALHAKVIDIHQHRMLATGKALSTFLHCQMHGDEDDDDESQSLLSPSVLQLFFQNHVSSKSFEIKILKLMISSGISKLANHKNRNYCFRCSHQCCDEYRRFCCFVVFVVFLSFFHYYTGLHTM